MCIATIHSRERLSANAELKVIHENSPSSKKMVKRGSELHDAVWKYNEMKKKET